MFPEYRNLISQLKQEDAHFSKIFDEHNKLDHEIIRLEQDPITQGIDTIDVLKRKKLKLKEELYEILQKADQN
ncbi:YdcH family protein [Acinetobacter piscicola]|uniref:YdcH family protein n=1 Tax=Acinetobacter piscicola TaxID=2006115 RepID=UPI0035579601